MAGSHQAAARKEALDVIDGAAKGLPVYDGNIYGDQHGVKTVSIQQFVILFYDSKSLSFRGVYGVLPNQGTLLVTVTTIIFKSD